MSSESIIGKELMELLERLKEQNNGGVHYDTESFGYFLQDYVIEGGELTHSHARKFHLAELVISFANYIYTVEAKDYYVSAKNASYYVDFTAEKGIQVSTEHPTTPYYPLWEVYMDVNGNIADQADKRGEIGGIKLVTGIDGMPLISDQYTNEIVQFRQSGGTAYGSISERLTADLNSIIGMFADKATRAFVYQILAQLGSMAPKEKFATLAALQTKYPTGAQGVYIVTADNQWYMWSGTAWSAGGAYNTALSPELVDVRTNMDGILFSTATDRVKKIEQTISSILNLVRSYGKNKTNTNAFRNIPYDTNHDITIPITTNEAFITGSLYRIKLAFTDGVVMDAGKATWKFNYADSTSSASVDASTAITKGAVALTSITLNFISNGHTAYAGKTIDYVMIYLSGTADLSYEEFTVTYGSPKVAEIDKKATAFDLHKLTDGWLYQYRVTDFSFTDGMALVSTDGTVSASGAYNAANTGVSYFIDCTGYTHVSCLVHRNFGINVAAVAFYQSDGTFISSYKEDAMSSVYKLIPVPPNAAKMRYSYYTDVRADALGMPRLAYIGLYNASALEVKQTALSTKVDGLQARYVRSDALFDPTKVTAGKGIAAIGIVDEATKFLSDYIPITNADTVYTVNGSGAVYMRFYDANKTFIKYYIANFSNPSTVISSIGGLENAAYFQFSDLLTKLDVIYVARTPAVKREALEQLPFNAYKNFNNGMINWWEGKVIVFKGDSLTGSNFIQTYAKRYLNLSKATNNGIGGTKLSGPANASGDSMWMDSRVNALDTTADAIILLGGQNDGAVTMGPLTLENYDTTTYAGALNVWISKIYYRYQKLSAGYYAGISYSGVNQVTTARDVLIFICTPFWVPSETDPYRTKTMANAVRTICNLWGIPVIDYAARSQLNPGVADLYWGTDRTHPYESCYRDRLVPVVIGELERYKPVDYSKANYL